MKSTAIRQLLNSLVLASLALSSAGTVGATETLAQRAETVINTRCMVCHGCFDAPCQLKLTSNAGLKRGASKTKVYDSSRLVSTAVTRLFDDGFSQEDWRTKGFYPVIDPDNHSAGVLQRMLDLKQDHPLAARGPMPADFDFSLNRKQQCPKQDEFDDFARDYPLWGMPYGLPGLNSEEHNTLTRWIEAGAPWSEPDALTGREKNWRQSWERFLNGDSLKQQLMSRYVYEHLFLASLYPENGEPENWYRLVRSSTPPGEPIGLIATRRPYDDPGVARVYYRLQQMPTAVLDKRHMPYALDTARMNWYRQLFLVPDYTLESLPSYDRGVGSNPFISFQAIPISSRYRFLLEEARFSIMNFIKGPVCRGQVALNVIDDRFWVMFVDPDKLEPQRSEAFLSTEADNLRLPVSKRGSVVDILQWRKYAKAQRRYTQAKAELMYRELEEEGLTLTHDIIWDGDGTNPNAALTVFRHFDTATVEQGFIGTPPKTAWVIDYPLLERIHYLLVAGFDVYGDVSHQLESRLYMDFLRMEGEENFLMFLPPETRESLHKHWYRGAKKATVDHVFAHGEVAARPADIRFQSNDPMTEFLATQRRRIYGAEAEAFALVPHSSSDVAETLQRLTTAASDSYSFMPQVSFLNVIGAKRDDVYTLLRDSGYSNITQLFNEENRRIPQEDRMTVVSGLIGAYPNTFLQVNEKDIDAFVRSINQLDSAAGYEALLQRFGVMRNSPWFWKISDKFHAYHRDQDPIEAGLFDYNRYQHQLSGSQQ